MLFPESGYRSETGGLMEELRSLSLETIRAYHHDYYRPENLCLLITGEVDTEQLLKTLDKVDQTILSRNTAQGNALPRPWMDSSLPVPLKETVHTTIDFPDEEERMGAVSMAWRGPVHHQHLDIEALHVLLTYLTDSPVALLQHTMVEVEDPYATSVGFHVLRYRETGYMLMWEGVPVEKMEGVSSFFMDVLRKHVQTQNEQSGVDMTRMHLILDRQKLKLLEYLENEPSEFHVRPVIQDFLYGQRDGSTLMDQFRDLEYLDTLRTFTQADWARLFQKYFLDAPFVCVRGNPSSAFAQKLKDEETARVAKQREELGEAQLKVLADRLEEAKAKNDRPIPDHILEAFPVPSLDGISRIPVQSVQYPMSAIKKSEDMSPLERHVKASSCSSIPFFMQFDHIQSAFVELNFIMNTSGLPESLRLHLPLYMVR